MSEDLQWNGDQAEKLVRTAAIDWVTRACMTVEKRAKELISIPGTSRERSHAGEPPRRQTGRLRGSVTFETDSDSTSATGRVGTNVLYGKFLELGTKRGIRPRPWLRRAFDEMQTKINSLLSQIGI